MFRGEDVEAADRIVEDDAGRHAGGRPEHRTVPQEGRDRRDGFQMVVEKDGAIPVVDGGGDRLHRRGERDGAERVAEGEVDRFGDMAPDTVHRAGGICGSVGHGATPSSSPISRAAFSEVMRRTSSSV